MGIRYMEESFPETSTISSYHFDLLKAVKKKTEESDKKKKGLFWPHLNRKVSKEHTCVIGAPWIQASAPTCTPLF